jgi:hypothetical protein
MSLFKSITNVAKKILSNPIATKVAAVIPGIGTGVALAGAAYQAYTAAQPARLPSPVSPSLPLLGGVSQSFGGPSMSMAGMLSPATAGRVLATGGRMVVAGGRSVARGAANLCRKYPQWCTTIGGTAAIEALMHSGQLPVPRRRRGKGITAHELKAFKRVARFTSKYCAPVHRAMKAPAVRKGASCR